VTVSQLEDMSADLKAENLRYIPPCIFAHMQILMRFL
jgi:hypothetical protein